MLRLVERSCSAGSREAARVVEVGAVVEGAVSAVVVEEAVSAGAAAEELELSGVSEEDGMVAGAEEFALSGVLEEADVVAGAEEFALSGVSEEDDVAAAVFIVASVELWSVTLLLCMKTQSWCKCLLRLCFSQ